VTTPAPDLVFGQPVAPGSPAALVFGDSESAVQVPLTPRDLVFSLPRIVGSPTNLLFGDDGTEVVNPPLTVDIAVTLANTVTVSSTVSLPVRADVAVSLSGSVTVTAACIYDNRVTPWLDQRAAAPHQTALADFLETSSEWGVSTPQRNAREMHWQTARQAGANAAVPADASVPMRRSVDVLWQRALQAQQQASLVHQKSVQHDLRRAGLYQTALQTGAESASPMQTGVFHDLRLSAEWQWAESKVRALTSPMGASGQRSGVQFADMPWQMAGQAHNGKSVLPVVQPPVVVIYPRDGHLLFECPPIVGSPTYLVFGARPCYPPPVDASTVVVPVRKVYMVFNEVALRRVDGNIALPNSSFTLSLDVDSWTWGFSAALPGSALPDLEPASSGVPVELEAMVNGTAFRVLVESIGRERTFGRNGIRVQGRGKTALLDSPYAPVRNFGNVAARTAQQLMGDALTVNGVPMDWALNWGLEDWLVPANVFAHQGSYISALNAIAAAAGGYIQPHASLQTLHILPRYPDAPWNWGGVTPDYELPSDVTTREGIEWVERARYNRVFVSGQQSGILGQVTRAGTAGDLLAPMVTDALITTAAAARQRGISVLANTGRQANVSLRLPVLPETGVITPGKFVRYTDAGTARLGIVRSVSVDANFPQVWQSIGVETHV
jgi:hypothetical protein